MGWLDLPEEIRAALAKPLEAPDNPDLDDPQENNDPVSDAPPEFPNAISYEDWKRSREWTILAPPS
ncbi:hypothetical protein ACFXHA_24795 [Nocardia sp. NPDC059240]|uniref:hypothetical protein n=1 Tax=Nocardia sp. NPDC059240 TaxID=3346786 RepID=UPI0036BE03DB